MSLLANLSDLLRPVDSRSIILEIFDPFSPSKYGIPLSALDDCWEKQTLFNFDMFWTPSESRRLCNSEADDTLLDILSCTWQVPDFVGQVFPIFGQEKKESLATPVRILFD